MHACHLLLYVLWTYIQRILALFQNYMEDRYFSIQTEEQKERGVGLHGNEDACSLYNYVKVYRSDDLQSCLSIIGCIKIMLLTVHDSLHTFSVSTQVDCVVWWLVSVAC